MILSGEDVAGYPAHVGTQIHQGLDEYGGLNGHVQRTGDLQARERLLWSVLLACGHQAGHLLLGQANLIATPLGEGEVSDLELEGVCLIRHGCLRHRCRLRR